MTSRGRKSAPSARTSLHPRFKLDSCATPLRQTETFQSTVCASSQGLWETCAMNASSHPTAFEHTLYQPQTRARLGTTGQVRPAVEGRARHPRQPASSPDSGHEQGACTLHLVCVCVCVRVCVWVGGWVGVGGWVHVCVYVYVCVRRTSLPPRFWIRARHTPNPHLNPEP